MECTCNSSSQIAVIDHCPSGLYGIGCTASMLLILNEYTILLRCCHMLCVCVCTWYLMALCAKYTFIIIVISSYLFFLF